MSMLRFNIVGRHPAKAGNQCSDTHMFIANVAEYWITRSAGERSPLPGDDGPGPLLGARHKFPPAFRA